MKGLDTNRGMNYLGVCFLALTVAQDIDGPWKQYVVSGVLLAMTIIAFLTRESGVEPHEGEQIKAETIEPSDDEVAAALKRVRGND